MNSRSSQHRHRVIPLSDKDQAEQALKYLDFTRMTEQGGYSETSLPKGRDLEKQEEEVKEAALTCLLTYFGQMPPAEPLRGPTKSTKGET